ncbi:unnamed protein product (macronuclear) [Paramecium tetraurelia]|uniref:Trichohyalin-plectin-homology domain-containing protein n=1 Tax=Paramecium tetraurelia TaxID=5888 RepID=A0DSK0_PARTE|nr:uncharacterized protein GSPATT00019721001 [Paramecium tetraurelia]CAK86017.1 unnamed protein product [Paramecium tetraurelia]|eukprot:XP_001453414.1 hypothetical protein (macronuclear) [Paramecium tetraurelia strain d4-2]
MLSNTSRGQQQNQFSKTQTQTLIPLSELNHIRGKLKGGNLAQEERQLDKMRMKANSEERMKRWPTSIAAYKQKRDQHRFEKFTAAEEERRKIDIEEEIFQKGEKKITLEKANKQIYEENDRVKAFHGKMLFSDVLLERDEQIVMEKYKKELLNQQEEIYKQIIEEQLEEYDQKETLKQKLQQQRKKEQKDMLHKQHEEMKEKYLTRLKEERIEGELIKQKVKDALEDEQKIQRLKQEKILENQRLVQQANDQLKEFKVQQKIKEKEEDEKIRQHADKKQRIAEMRKVREDLKFHEKQEQRQKMIDRQIQQLEIVKKAQEEHLNKQIIEAQVKAEEVEKIKKQKKEQMCRAIDYSRKIKDEVKDREAKSVDYHKKEFQTYWEKRGRELEEIERAEITAQRERRVQNSRFQQDQINEKIGLREKEYLEQLDQQEEKQRKIEKEDEIFMMWASQKIQEQSREGKNILPLIKELKNLSKVQ